MKTDGEDLEEMIIMFNEYLQSIDKKFYSKYYFNFYYPYIRINDDENVVVRISINSYDRGNPHFELKDLLFDELVLLNKHLPIYYETYGSDQTIIDVYREELIKMMNNRIRKIKLNNLFK